MGRASDKYVAAYLSRLRGPGMPWRQLVVFIVVVVMIAFSARQPRTEGQLTERGRRGGVKILQSGHLLWCAIGLPRAAWFQTGRKRAMSVDIGDERGDARVQRGPRVGGYVSYDVRGQSGLRVDDFEGHAWLPGHGSRRRLESMRRVYLELRDIYPVVL